MSAPISTSPPGSIRFSLEAGQIDVEALRATLSDNRAGAVASFEGIVRNHNDGRAVTGLRYDSYPALAQAEGEAILQEALQRFDIIAARCTHRVGEVGIGAMAIWAGASAAHRDAAFAAVRWIVDEVKARVPIWKHERYVDGDAGWLHPESATGDCAIADSDDAAASSGNPAG